MLDKSKRIRITEKGRQSLSRVLHPIAALTYFAAGSRLEILDRAPSDRVWHSVLGTMVLIASSLAAFGAFATAGFIRTGAIKIGAIEIACGVAWGLLIFAFDRSIVRMPLLPVHLNDRVVGMLWNSSSDVKWYVETVGNRPVSLTEPQWHRTPMMLLAAVPRIGIAIATAFVFSETLLFVYFQQDLKPVMASIASANTRELERHSQEDYTRRLEELNRQLDELRRALDKPPTIAELNARLTEQETISKNAAFDAGVYGELYSKERAAQKVTLKLSDGSTRTTSGDPDSDPNRPGIQSGNYLAEQEGQLDIQERADAKIKSLRERINKRTQRIESNKQYKELEKKVKDLNPAPVPPVDPEAIKGVGIRRVALADYANDANPLTPERDTRVSSCGGNFLCDAWQTLVPPTPAGPIVGSVRIIFFLIELSPLLFKIAYTLRRNRPYDTALAQMELLTSGELMSELSRQLGRYGQSIEEDGRERRARRGAEAAEYIVSRNEGVRRTSRNPDIKWWQWHKRLDFSGTEPRPDGERRPPKH
jgi:Domain of unknown function (DUF4407)